MPATVPINHILRFLPLENIKSVQKAHLYNKNTNHRTLLHPISEKRKRALNLFSTTKTPLKFVSKLVKARRKKKFETNHPNAYGRNNYKFYKNILGSIRQVPLHANTKKAIMNKVLRNMKPYPLNYPVYNNHPNRSIKNYNLKIGNNIVRAGLQKNYMSGYRAKYVKIFIKQPNNTYILHRANRKGRHEYNRSNNLVYHPYLTGRVNNTSVKDSLI